MNMLERRAALMKHREELEVEMADFDLAMSAQDEVNVGESVAMWQAYAGLLQAVSQLDLALTALDFAEQFELLVRHASRR